MATILGIDPGLNATGWGIIHQQGTRLQYVASGTIRPSSSLPLSERLMKLHKELTRCIDVYQPTECAIEETFVNNNPTSSLKLGHARGTLMLTAALAHLPVCEYAATLVKKSVTGVGRAAKEQVSAMVKHLLPGSDADSADAADALAIAICHSSHRNVMVPS